MGEIARGEEAAARLLIGRAVTVSVGEPWDFEGPDGTNRLEGRIVGAEAGEEGDPRSQALTIRVRPFDSGEGVRVARLRATRRYADETGIVEQVANGEAAPAGFGYAEQVPEGKRLPNSHPGLVGSVRLKDVRRIGAR